MSTGLYWKRELFREAILRQVITPIRALLRYAAEHEMVATLPIIKKPKVAKPPKECLLPSQVVALIRAAAPHVRPMLAFAVATGARPSEHLDLTWKEVDLRGKRVRLSLKGPDGQRKIRHYDMPSVALAALESLPHREGAVFRTRKGTRYRDTGRSGGGQFKVAWSGACQRSGLPGEVRCYNRKDRQTGRACERFAPEHTPYVLRHSWASWHYCIHKDLKLLESDGGWESQAMLDVYVHLLPAAYRDEVIAFLSLVAPVDPSRKTALRVHRKTAEALRRLPYFVDHSNCCRRSMPWPCSWKASGTHSRRGRGFISRVRATIQAYQGMVRSTCTLGVQASTIVSAQWPCSQVARHRWVAQNE